MYIMKVKTIPNQTGFEEIRIQNRKLLNEKGVPKTRIQFILPIASASYLENQEIIPLTRLGYAKYVANDYCVITIKGQHRITRAIDIFLKLLKEDPYKGADNTKLIAQLESKQSEIFSSLPKRKVPSMSIDSDDYTFIKEVEARSVNKTDEVLYKDRLAFLKPDPRGRAIIDNEVFSSLCLQVLLGDKSAKTVSVYRKDGTREGVLSIGIPGFEPLLEYEGKKIPIEILLKHEIVKIWTACYCEEENDLHRGNYGLMGKIDHGQTTFPLIKKYVPFISEHFNFKVTKRDIQMLPEYRDAYVAKGPHAQKEFFQLDELRKDPEYYSQKYFILLKRILLPKEFYQEAAKASCSSEIREIKLAAHKNARTQALKSELLDMPEFVNYIIKNRQVLNKALAEFDHFNQSFKQMRPDTALSVDLKMIKENYADLLSLCHLVKAMEKIVADISTYINSRKRGSISRYFRNEKLTEEKLKLATSGKEKLEEILNSLKSDPQIDRKDCIEKCGDIFFNLELENSNAEAKYGVNRNLKPTKSDLLFIIHEAGSSIKKFREEDEPQQHASKSFISF